MIILVVFSVAALVGWAVVLASFGRIIRAVRIFALASLGVAAVAAYFTTYQYRYSPNANTVIYGWPIFYVAFQRADAASGWSDFVSHGTLTLAYPLNFILFAVIPSVVTIVLARKFPPRDRAVRASCYGCGGKDAVPDKLPACSPGSGG